MSAFDEIAKLIQEEYQQQKAKENQVPFLKRLNDIYSALSVGACESALALTLTVPDVCGMILQPTEKASKKRYIKWLDNYVAVKEKEKSETSMRSGNVPNISIIPDGETVYELRCKYLHQHLLPTKESDDTMLLPKLVAKRAKNSNGRHVQYLSDVIGVSSIDDSPYQTNGRFMSEPNEFGFYSTKFSVLNVPEFIYTLCGHAYAFYKENSTAFAQYDGKWLSIYETDNYIG